MNEHINADIPIPPTIKPYFKSTSSLFQPNWCMDIAVPALKNMFEYLYSLVYMASDCNELLGSSILYGFAFYTHVSIAIKLAQKMKNIETQTQIAK